MNVASIIPEQAEEALQKTLQLLHPLPMPGTDVEVRQERRRLLSAARLALGRILLKKGDHQGAVEQVQLAKQFSPMVDLGSLKCLITQTVKKKMTTLSFVYLSGETIATLPVEGEWNFLDIRAKLNEYVPPGMFVQHLLASGNRINDADTVDMLALPSGECLQTIICSVASGVYGASRLKYNVKLDVDGRFELESERWRTKWRGRLEKGCLRFDGEEPDGMSLSLDPEDGSLWMYFSHPKETIFRLRQRTAHDIMI